MHPRNNLLVSKKHAHYIKRHSQTESIIFTIINID